MVLLTNILNNYLYLSDQQCHFDWMIINEENVNEHIKDIVITVLCQSYKQPLDSK